ncbi:hypothetical protein AURDEDRAFT_159170 [Auricularia subglabra TFB-10046 SS5]|nr:hypothetical protein AURDEDRAFT_159170 [Auricularia subglabra TFB-10046 SS5]
MVINHFRAAIAGGDGGTTRTSTRWSSTSSRRPRRNCSAPARDRQLARRFDTAVVELYKKAIRPITNRMVINLFKFKKAMPNAIQTRYTPSFDAEDVPLTHESSWPARGRVGDGALNGDHVHATGADYEGGRSDVPGPYDTLHRMSAAVDARSGIGTTSGTSTTARAWRTLTEGHQDWRAVRSGNRDVLHSVYGAVRPVRKLGGCTKWAERAFGRA